MLPLFDQMVKYCLRTKIVWGVFGLGVLFHWASMGLMSHSQITVTGNYSASGFILKPVHHLGVALSFQLFLGGLLAVVFGVWSMPYLHRGSRALITYVLPLNKWNFIGVYTVTLVVLMGLLHFILLFCYGAHFGFSLFMDAEFPLLALFSCLVLETLAVVVFASGLSVCSLTMGPIPSIFFGVAILFLLQISGIIYHLDVASVLRESTFGRWYFGIYQWLPPFGEVFIALTEQFKLPSFWSLMCLRWAIWWVIFASIFTYKVTHPALASGNEN